MTTRVPFRIGAGARNALVLTGLVVSMLAATLPSRAQEVEEPTPEPTSSSEPSVANPSIISHKDDYIPGEAVVLLGEAWEPSEAIQLSVNDDEGKTWSYAADVTAAEDGTIRHEFFLPGWFVAAYSVTATGSLSGTATTSFTDSIVSGSAQTNQNGGLGGAAASSLTILKPTPIAVGDFMLAQVTFTHGSDINNLEAPNPPSSWTLVRRTNRGSDLGQAIYYKVATSSDAAPGTLSYTWQFKNGSSLQAERAAGGITRYTGVATTNPIVDSSGNPGDSASLRALSVNAEAGSMLVGFFGIMKQTTLSTPSGMSERYIRQHTNGSGPTVKATEEVRSIAGATGDRTSTAGASEKWLAQLVSLRPAATNTVPVATTPAFSPSSPKTNDLLGASSTITDADGNNVTGTFVWKVTRSGITCDVRTFTTTPASGAGGGSVHADALNLGTSHSTTNCTGPNPGTIDPSRGDTITVTVTPNDGTAAGTTQSNSLVVANTAPVATVSLDGSAPDTDDTLVATATKSDADGDPVSLTFVWKVNGVTRQTTTTSSSLTDTFDLSSAGNGDKGDTIEVFVTPNDGTVDGATVSASATVANSAPVATTPSFSPASPKTNDVLEASSEITDGDGDTVTGAFVWKVQSGDDTCTVRQLTTASAPSGSVHSDSLDLGMSHPASECSGITPFPSTINPSRGDTITAEVTPDDGTTAGTTQTDSLVVANSPPTVALSGPDSVAESTSDVRVYSFTVTDADGGPFDVVSRDCGTGGTAVGGVYDLTATGGKFDCRFTDGPAGPTVTITIEDDEDAQDDDSIDVTVNNVAPTVAFTAGPTAVAESGTAEHTYSYSISDPGDDTVQSVSTSCGTGGTKVPSSDSNTDTAGSFKCTFVDGPASPQATAQATDSDGDPGNTATRDITVSNVVPTTSNPSFTVDPITGQATASFDFADDGTADTHTASFSWSHGAPGSGPSVVESNGAGTASETRQLPPGCYDLTVSGTVTDDDGGTSDPQTIVTSHQVDVYAIAFAPPIKDNERNIAKYGNVVPVKVRITSGCTGGSIVTPSLYLSYVRGTDGEIIEGTESIAQTVSSADGAGGQMRLADGMYLYNFSTRPLTPGINYTLRVRYGSSSGPVVLAAVLQPKR